MTFLIVLRRLKKNTIFHWALLVYLLGIVLMQRKKRQSYVLKIVKVIPIVWKDVSIKWSLQQKFAAKFLRDMWIKLDLIRSDVNKKLRSCINDNEV